MPTYNLGSLRLSLVTFRGDPIGGDVEIRLRNLGVRDERTVKAVASGPILISDLFAFPGGLYEVQVFPAVFEPESRFAEIGPSQITDLRMVFRGRGDDDDSYGAQHCPPPKIPDQFDEKGLTTELGIRLTGTPADGAAPRGEAPQKVIWVEHGDEVLVHLDSMRVRILEGMVLVSVDLETDQTGRTPLVVSFAVSHGNDPAGLVAVTDEFPRGNGLLASRWGHALQAAAWQSLLSIAKDHATERALAPLGIAASRGRLSLQAGASLQVAGVRR